MHAVMPATQSAATQPAATMPALPTIDPTHSFVYPPASVSGVTLSHDGESLLLVRHHTAIDLWDALTYWWPEAAIALALLALLTIALRVTKRPNALGLPHCRQCGYLLLNMVETRCPECGLERATERPRFGQRRGWRIAVLVVIALSYAYVARFGHLRPVRPLFFAWFDWPREELVQRAQTTMPWLNTCTIRITSIFRQPLSGEPEQLVAERISGGFGSPTVMQRGKSLALFARHEVVLIDLATGRLIHRRQLDKRHGCLHPSTTIANVALPRESDDAIVWVLLNTGSIRRWNLETNVSEEVLYLPTYDGRGFAETLASGGRVAVPTYLTHEPGLMMLDDPQDKITIHAQDWGGGWPSVSPTGDVIAGNFNQRGVAAIDVRARADGSLIHRIYAPSRGGTSVPPLFTPDGQHLIATVHGNTMQILIADVHAGAWVAQLGTPNLAHSQQTLAVHARPSRIMRTGHAATFVIDVYDLDQLPARSQP